MKRFWSFIIGATFMTACVPNNSVPYVTEGEIIKPPYLVLQTEQKQFHGLAIPIEDSIFVALRGADQNGDNIFWGDKKINIEQRLIEQNIVFVRIENQDLPLAKAHQDSPIIGQTVYWLDRNNILSGQIQSVTTENFTITGMTGKDILSSPVFLADGQVLGILSAANPKQQSLTSLRLQPLVDFWSQNK